MTILVSMLRGINVSGHNMIRMPDLKALYESAGFTDVSTYIQSGNVIFRSDRGDASSIGKSIEAAIEKAFGFSVVVIIRRPSELARVIDTCPFRGSDKIDESRLHVTFLRTKPAPALIEALEPLAAKSPDQYKVLGSEVFLYCPGGYGKTLLSNAFFEKRLKVSGTTRNWRTVNTLNAMALAHQERRLN